MSEAIQYEVHLAILSIGTGVGLMVLYDFFRILRMFVKHNTFWTGLRILDIGSTVLWLRLIFCINKMMGVCGLMQSSELWQGWRFTSIW